MRPPGVMPKRLYRPTTVRPGVKASRPRHHIRANRFDVTASANSAPDCSQASGGETATIAFASATSHSSLMRSAVGGEASGAASSSAAWP